MEFIKNLNDSDLVNSLKKLVDQERKLLYVILEHIKEVELRQLHLARGFKSLKEYMMKEFGYSGSAADRRISAALLLGQVPSVAAKVQDGSLNLTQIVTLSVAIKDKERIEGFKLSSQNKQDLVESIAGLNGRDTQYEIAHTLNLPIKQFEKSQVQADESYRVELTLSKQQREDLMFVLEQMAQGLAQERQEINMANVIGKMAAERREEIELRLSKRKVQLDKIESKKTEGDGNKKLEEESEVPELNESEVAPAFESKQSNKMTASETAVVSECVNKSVTAKTRQLVLVKNGCCAFKDHKTGRVCGSKFAVQTDHIKSRRNGGSNSFENLQTLCARHNRFKYDQERTLEFNFLG